MNVCVVIDGEEQLIHAVFSSLDKAIDEMYDWYYDGVDPNDESYTFRTKEEVRAIIEEKDAWALWQFFDLPLDTPIAEEEGTFFLTCYDD